jgi:hypothetical protein
VPSPQGGRLVVPFLWTGGALFSCRIFPLGAAGGRFCCGDETENPERRADRSRMSANAVGRCSSSPSRRDGNGATRTCLTLVDGACNFKDFFRTFFAPTPICHRFAATPCHAQKKASRGRDSLPENEERPTLRF